MIACGIIPYREQISVEEVTKKAVRESLIANKDLAYLSLDLATIRIDSPVVLDWNEARLGVVYRGCVSAVPEVGI